MSRSAGRRRYREARVEPGEIITVVGFVEPFDQLSDPSGADAMTGWAGDGGAATDEAMAADLGQCLATARY